MKRILIYALLLGAMISCYKQGNQFDENLPEKVKLSISLPQASTKMADVGNDANVKNVQVFVFRSSGDLDTYAYSTTTSFDLTCTTGPKKIYALVNAPDLSSITNLSGLQNASSNLIDNKREGLIMVKDTTLNVLTDMSLNLKMKRLAARICLKSIQNSMESQQHKNMSFKVNSIYLINVVGDRRYFSATTPTVWYNKLERTTELGRLLSDDLVNNQIGYGETYNTNHYFYCYPNSQSEDSSSSTWSPRYTRLVVEANFGGKLCYYPVSIPNIQQNKAYSISLVVTIPGSTSPDNPIEKINQGITIEVEEWEISEEIVETI